MSLPAQPSSKETKTTVKPAPQDPRSYLAIMALAVLMLPSGLARAYRGDKSGWTRFWTYIAANIVMIIPFIGWAIGGLVIFVLVILGAIDVFKLRNATTDAFGAPLTMTPTDKKWGHGFYIYFIVMLVVIGLILASVVALAAFGAQQYQLNSDTFMQQMDSSYPAGREYYNTDSF